ncbi:hypothetical protein [Hathewaya limosa]|uniref:Lipoprotein n=1 Tax=Hathewaya limosa TaxID=1536 RepID=A0ABU0JVY0_HATLI|nr:hypothetical protein [Hathewaya limosa]MDQ0480293.1 hypothetical protein [Hathewaya limosa]
MKNKIKLLIIIPVFLVIVGVLSSKLLDTKSEDVQPTSKSPKELEKKDIGIKHISDDEYFKKFAKANHISIEKAKALDKEITLNFEKSQCKDSKTIYNDSNNYNKVCITGESKILRGKKNSLSLGITAVAKIYSNEFHDKEFVCISSPIVDSVSNDNFKFESSGGHAEIVWYDKSSVYLTDYGVLHLKASYAEKLGISIPNLKGAGFSGDSLYDDDTYFSKEIEFTYKKTL